MYRLVRPLLFRLDPEQAHELVLANARLISRFYIPPALDPALTQTIHGTTFVHPLGLAAGADKNGIAMPLWESLGFAFAELGTVTPEAQSGNPRPRVVRLEQAEGVLNRMGFPNEGVKKVNLNRNEALIPVGVSIGKNLTTPLDLAHLDYQTCASVLQWGGPLAYVAVNVSSPNTQGLRTLQTTEALTRIIRAIRSVCRRRIAVKIAPDLTDAGLSELMQCCLDLEVDFIIATNTWARPHGGLSGKAIETIAIEYTRKIFRQIKGKIPIIGVGGIHDGQSALDRIEAGASLIQLYTAMIYQGPRIVKEIVEFLRGKKIATRIGVRA